MSNDWQAYLGGLEVVKVDLHDERDVGAQVCSLPNFTQLYCTGYGAGGRIAQQQMVLCQTGDWLNILEMIHDRTKAKQEHTRGTTAEEQLNLPHITKDTTPRARQVHKHRDRSQGKPELNYFTGDNLADLRFGGRITQQIQDTYIGNL